MSDYIDDAINAAELSCENEFVEDEIYLSTLRSSRGELTRRIRMQPGLNVGPTTGQLVYYLATTIQNVSDCQDFLEWADETGKSVSDHEVLAEYRELVRQLDEFKLVLGNDVFTSLMMALSIDQAISRAKSSL